MYGTLTIDLKEATLANSVSQTEIKTAKCTFKLLTQIHESPNAEGKHGKNETSFAWKSCTNQFTINETNHVFDLFIEVWKDDGHGSSSATPADNKGAADKKDDKRDDKKDDKKPEKKDDKKADKKDDKKGAEKKEINTNLLGQSRLSLYDTKSKFNTPLPIFNQDYKQVGQIKLQAKIKHDKDAKKKAIQEGKK